MNRQIKKWHRRLTDASHPIRCMGASLGMFARPTALIIGAQKCGTTALFDYLAQHPATVAPYKKEISYFSHDHRYRRGLSWYLAHFPTRARLGKGMTFEASPQYIYRPEAHSRIHQFDPKMKLIALLRDPVERAFSHWNMFRDFWERNPAFVPQGRDHLNWSFTKQMQGTDGKILPFEELIRLETEAMPDVGLQPEPSLVRRGLYAEQLARFVKRFGRERVLIVESNELRRETHQVMKRVWDFLELDEVPMEKTDVSPRHTRSYEQGIDPGANGELRKFFRNHNEKLFQLIDRDLGWNNVCS